MGTGQLSLFDFGQDDVVAPTAPQIAPQAHQDAPAAAVASTPPPAALMALRPYQVETIEAVEAGWSEVSRQLIEIPTGGGKTIIFSNLAARGLPGRTLILAHQNELIEQAVDKLYQATGIIADVEKAERTASLKSDIVVASVQTMARRLAKFAPDHFQWIICDEAHLSVSQQWQTVLQHFAPAKVLGVTATPDRSDGKDLMAFYQRVAIRVKLFDLIKAGYLARISVRTVPIEIDVRSVGQKGGDYDAEQLDVVLAPYFDKVCAAIKEHAADRKCLVFVPLIKTSLTFVNACHRAGIGARHIDGDSDRRQILQGFKDGQFQVMANSQLLTTGYDEPSIDCVINLRPTKSRTLYAQCIGRGTRIKPATGKHTDLLILDFLWQFEKHVIMGPEHLIAKDEQQAKRIRRKYTKEFSEMDLEVVDSIAAKEKELELIEALKNTKRKGEYFDAMAFAAMTGDRDLMEYAAQTSEEAAPPTQRQIERLSQLGFQAAAVTSHGQAELVLAKAEERRQRNLCTGKQLYFLRKHHVPNAENMTRDEASAELSKRWGKR
jgi:superfamily II DNA or RNA helicase